MNNSTVSVFTASSSGHSHVYSDAVYILGKRLASNKNHVVFGGGESGLMGKLASGILSNDGALTALIPEIYYDPAKMYNPNITVVRCTDKDDRLNRFLASEFCIVAPGGFGSLGELGIAMTHTVDATYVQDARVSPLIFFNSVGYWDNIKSMANKIVTEGFAKEVASQLFRFTDNPDEIIEIINKGPIPVSRLSHQ